jgi:hypothetical protein
MAVLSMMRVQGDPEALAAGVREHLVPVGERLAEKHGGLFNVVAKTDDGVLIVNLWETDEGRHAMAAEPEVQAAVQAAGLPVPRFEALEVLVLRVSERAVAAAPA